MNVDAEIKQYQSCKVTVKAVFPHDIPGVLQYGNGVKAHVIQLIVAQMVALNRVVEMMEALIGRTISEATLLNYEMRLHLALESWEKRTMLQLLTSVCMHTDETSMRVNKQNHWIHVYSSGELTCHSLMLHQVHLTYSLLIKYVSSACTHFCHSKSYISYNYHAPTSWKITTSYFFKVTLEVILLNKL